jgi:hypothetical protein
LVAVLEDNIPLLMAQMEALEAEVLVRILLLGPLREAQHQGKVMRVELGLLVRLIAVAVAVAQPRAVLEWAAMLRLLLEETVEPVFLLL